MLNFTFYTVYIVFNGKLWYNSIIEKQERKGFKAMVKTYLILNEKHDGYIIVKRKQDMRFAWCQYHAKDIIDESELDDLLFLYEAKITKAPYYMWNKQDIERNQILLQDSEAQRKFSVAIEGAYINHLEREKERQ